MRVIKYRGRNFVGGFHDYNIIRGGLAVHPRLVAASSRAMRERAQLRSDLPALDTMLGGGLEEGTSTLIVGPPGTGKSSLAAQFVAAANKRGHPAAMFLFEESTSNLLNRTDGLGLGLRGWADEGLLTIQQIDPAELSPGQFASAACRAADAGAKVIVIDSLNGYLNAVPEIGRAHV